MKLFSQGYNEKYRSEEDFCSRRFELIIRQIKGEYSAKNPKLRENRNTALDHLKKFEKYELTSLPRTQNSLANELAFAASTCRLPHANEKYTVKVKYRLEFPDNIDYWQVFENEKQIEDFLQPKTNF